MKNNETILLEFVNTNSTRRDFIYKNLRIISSLTLGTYTLAFLNSCSDNSNPTSPSGNNNAVVNINITESSNSALQNIGETIAIGSNELDNSGMLVIRQSNTTIVALSRTCTHQGCTVPNFINGVSTCPCHGSKYDTAGKVLQGPAPAPLKKYNATLAGDIITIGN